MQMRITIEGNIGSGKSTCVEALRMLTHGWVSPGEVMLEPVNSWRDWLTDAYAGRSVHFELQMAVLLSYARGFPQSVVSERSPFTAMEVFTRQLVLEGKISTEEHDVLLQVFGRVGWIPCAMIYIDTPPEVCLQRIRGRGAVGEAGIEYDYLEGLAQRHAEMFRDFKGRVIVVDGDRPSREVMKDVLQALTDLQA